MFRVSGFMADLCKKLIMESKEFTKAAVFSFESAIEYNDGAIVSRNVLKKETGNISLFAFDRGESLSPHTAPYDAMVDVVDGKAEIIIGGTSHFLEKGQSIIMPADIMHSVKAVERFKMVLTMIRSK